MKFASIGLAALVGFYIGGLFLIVSGWIFRPSKRKRVHLSLVFSGVGSLALVVGIFGFGLSYYNSKAEYDRYTASYMKDIQDEETTNALLLAQQMGVLLWIFYEVGEPKARYNIFDYENRDVSVSIVSDLSEWFGNKFGPVLTRFNYNVQDCIDTVCNVETAVNIACRYLSGLDVAYRERLNARDIASAIAELASVTAADSKGTKKLNGKINLSRPSGRTSAEDRLMRTNLDIEALIIQCDRIKQVKRNANFVACVNNFTVFRENPIPMLDPLFNRYTADTGRPIAFRNDKRIYFSYEGRNSFSSGDEGTSQQSIEYISCD